MQLYRQKIVLSTRQTTHSGFQKVLEHKMRGRWHVSSRTKRRNTLATQRTQQACSSSAATRTLASGATEQILGEALKLAADTPHNLLQTFLPCTATNSPHNTQSLPAQDWVSSCFLVILYLKHRTAFILPSKQEPSQELQNTANKQAKQRSTNTNHYAFHFTLSVWIYSLPRCKK